MPISNKNNVNNVDLKALDVVVVNIQKSHLAVEKTQVQVYQVYELILNLNLK